MSSKTQSLFLVICSFTCKYEIHQQVSLSQEKQYFKVEDWCWLDRAISASALPQLTSLTNSSRRFSVINAIISGSQKPLN